MSGWIGVDFDGTLAKFDPTRRGDGYQVLGEPVALMVDRVKAWLHGGIEVRIVTARAGDRQQEKLVQEWLKVHVGRELPITNAKDFGMVELWDDSAVQVIRNTGERADRR